MLQTTEPIIAKLKKPSREKVVIGHPVYDTGFVKTSNGVNNEVFEQLDTRLVGQIE